MTDHHDHSLGVTADPTRPHINIRALDALVGAAFDGCATCQDAQLTLVVDDPPAVARLVEVTCGAVHGIFGGLPHDMITPGAAGPTSDEFRTLASIGADDNNVAMYERAAQMNATERRAATNTALDIMVGLLSTS